VKRALIIILVILFSMPVMAQDDIEVTDCATRLAKEYVLSYLWGTAQYEGPINEISTRLVKAYKAFAPVATDNCAEIPFGLSATLFFNLDLTFITETGAARIYDAIYEEIGDMAIDDASCAYQMIDGYWSFNKALGEMRDVDKIINVAVGTWRTTYAITGDLACEDDPALMLTMVTIQYADTDVAYETDPALIRSIYEDIKQKLDS
jgi:hypothetical protein